MREDALDAISNSLIEEFGKGAIEARRLRQNVKSTSIDLDELRKSLPEKPKHFDLVEVISEAHLRELIMDRVL
ncbi:MAG: hypothetical protein LBO21_06840, partial [Synergistaceae bacterium]|nr:hypothetical protein [Synergistaceae bacterium]